MPPSFPSHAETGKNELKIKKINSSSASLNVPPNTKIKGLYLYDVLHLIASYVIWWKAIGVVQETWQLMLREGFPIGRANGDDPLVRL